MLDTTRQAHEGEFTSVVSPYHQGRQDGQVAGDKGYSQLLSELSQLKRHSDDDSWSLIWQLVDEYLNNAEDTAHPHYFKQLRARESEQALIGGVIELMAKTAGQPFTASALSSVIEEELGTVFARQLGLDGWESEMTSNAARSNVLALQLAQQRRNRSFKVLGLAPPSKSRIYVSAEAHYSPGKQAMLLDPGLQLVEVPVDAEGAMDIERLSTMIQSDREAGCAPLMIVGTAGTTIRGAFDSVAKLVAVARLEQCWLHIDGARGGAMRYSHPAADGFLDGLEQVDSFSWDVQTLLAVPRSCSMIFARESGAFQNSVALRDSLPASAGGVADVDSILAFLQRGHHLDVLDMWFECLFYGEPGFRDRIDHYLALSGFAERRVQSDQHLELQNRRWANALCFRSKPAGITDREMLALFNQEVHDRLSEVERRLAEQAYLDEDLTIRLKITDKNLVATDIARFFDQWIVTSRAVEKEWLA